MDDHGWFLSEYTVRATNAIGGALPPNFRPAPTLPVSAEVPAALAGLQGELAARRGRGRADGLRPLVPRPGPEEAPRRVQGRGGEPLVPAAGFV